MEESLASFSLKMMTLNNSGNALALCTKSVPSTLAHLLHGKKACVLYITKTDEPSNYVHITFKLHSQYKHSLPTKNMFAVK